MSDERTLVITRLLDAPRAMVFAAWIDQDQAAQWWGPKGFTSVSCTMHVRVGGVWRRVMRSPDGAELTARGVYREIAAPERLVFTYAWEDAAGNPKHETLVTLTFADLGGKTELTLRHALFETVAARDDHRDGWSGCLERFAEYLASRSR
jgi:uncharacterized protein YndB with AHSA1/START domain